MSVSYSYLLLSNSLVVHALGDSIVIAVCTASDWSYAMHRSAVIHWPVVGSLLHFAMKQETDWSQSRTQSMVTSSTTYTPINGNILNYSYILNYLHTTVLGPVSATLC